MTAPDTTPTRPLTASERLIWAGQRLDPDVPLYNMALAIEVPRRLDATILGEALRRVVAGADALRTVVRERDGSPTCVVLKDAEVALDTVKIAGPWDPAALSARIKERVRRALPLDGPMTDVALFQGQARSVLFINQHHLVTDATSTGIFYRRLASTYGALKRGEDPALSDVPQYAAYAQYLEEMSDSPHVRRAREHWEAARQGRSKQLRFYGVEAKGSGRTKRIRVSIGEERAAALEALIHRQEFRALSLDHSRFLVFATVLAAWMRRATDDTQLELGVPAHNRSTADFRNTLGLFIELYPLRIGVGPDESFTSLAERVSEGTLQMMRHSVPGSSPATGALEHAVVLNYITAQLGDFAGLPAHADWVHSGFGDPAHVLRLQVHDFGGSGIPTLDFDLDESVFGPKERAWVVDHFLLLFDALVEDPSREIRGVELVSWEEEQLFAPRGARVARTEGLLASFGRHVEQRPDAVAVVDGDRSWSYGELSREGAAIARRLTAEAAVGPGDVVGICLERGALHIAAILGVLRTGAAYLPLDPDQPDERLALHTADAGVSLVVAQPSGAARVKGWSESLTTFAPLGSRSGPGPAPFDPSSPPAETVDWPDAPDDALAYVLYTSGSTGRPKGVEVTHGALADYLLWAQRTYDRGERLRWPWFTSCAYDLSVTSMLTPLVSGGQVVSYSGESHADGLLVRDVFHDNRVDVVKLTPSHLELVRDLDLSRCAIHRLVLGGENLRTALARQASEALGGGVEIYNEYGPTEATVACMIHRYDPSTDTGASVPIGVPADNMAIHVLGPGGTPTLRGESGEICIVGPRLANGYRGKPELTSHAFVPDPTGDARMYRTGDLGRWNASGVLEFLGRADDQVKIGGIRLELGEVEAALARHPSIREVSALVIDASQTVDDRRCRECGLEGAHPEARIDDSGLCRPCARFAEERIEVARYFGSPDDLARLLEDARTRTRGPHDCIMLASGGKDSTYALCRIVEMGANPLVFLLDNGFISEQAKDNVRRVTDLLGLELVIGTTPAMPAIFNESLRRFSNVCQGCFKAVYTLALNLAVERGIGAIVTGLSRGQIFETRLADLYRRRIYDPEVVDRTIDEARRAYHRMDDSVAPLWDVGDIGIDEVLDRVRFIDFYRYVDVELDELLRYVGETTPWIRPSDTGRSTNCLINEAGIFVHLAERRFHNYALPYSWDVRLGHKRRNDAVAELQDDLQLTSVRRMLDEVGYRERPATSSEARLVAYYVADAELSTSELRALAAERLPRAGVPSSFVRLESMPLTDHGKVRRDALPVPGIERPSIGTPFVEPSTPTQWILADVWAEVLGLGEVGIHDDFFELGGESIRGIQVASVARERGLAISPRDLFRNPTIAGLSAVAQPVEDTVEPLPAEVSPEELDSLSREFG